METILKTFRTSDKKGAFLSSDDSVLVELRKICVLLEEAYTKFEYAHDVDLVESAIFEINSLMSRYRYFIRLAKEQNISSQTIGNCYLPDERVS